MHSMSMSPIQVLPDVTLQERGVISAQYLQQGVSTFHEACQWTKDLPYGVNSSNEDSLILFAEERGTCTTKHGAIARLALEHDLPIRKNLGFYRLNDDIVTGVNALLAPHGLAFIPQIHCFLAYEDYRVDLTEGNCNGKNKTIETYDFVVSVAPDLTQAQHHAYYYEYLQQYVRISPALAALSEVEVMTLLADCDRQLKYQCSIAIKDAEFGVPVTH
ncbi:hypothetical protein KR51_00002060 [Rubidibacter lacunae KORDI 51-2]|uniref:Uncharacterized protein n=1 Tax=Rubidibacter lacunae KORDI 51-2 TaxID=582515 RepID=U5DTA1_9CHRO|nr:hypothetical protein [Rubidibacter lacunae]ERN42910.1 hypothetical protein KR51_00002060 [Rubidibacter lacunae KORDI 51-2]